MHFSSFVLVAALAARSVSAHGVITTVTGANGVTGQGFGVDPSTPRDGSRRNPFQQDSSIIRDREIQSGKADACGRTLGGGVNDIAASMQIASAAGMPAAAADGSVTMTLHQVNGDGAGPYTCEVNADGTGQQFTAMTVTQQVPGENSRSRAKATDFPLTAKMPAGAACTGGPNGNACIVRCRNSARAGPFGGCVAVTNANGGAAAGAANGTAAAAGGNAAQAAQAGNAANAAQAGTAANAAQAGTAANAAQAGTAANAAQAGAAQAGNAAAAGTAAKGAAAQAGAANKAGAAAGNAAQAGAAQAGNAAAGTAAKGAAAQQGAAAGGADAAADAALAADLNRRDDISTAEREAALAEDLDRREDEVSDEERDAALAADLERRLVAVQRRMLKSRIVGTQNLGRWI